MCRLRTQDHRVMFRDYADHIEVTRVHHLKKFIAEPA